VAGSESNEGCHNASLVAPPNGGMSKSMSMGPKDVVKPVVVGTVLNSVSACAPSRESVIRPCSTQVGSQVQFRGPSFPDASAPKAMNQLPNANSMNIASCVSSVQPTHPTYHSHVSDSLMAVDPVFPLYDDVDSYEMFAADRFAFEPRLQTLDGGGEDRQQPDRGYGYVTGYGGGSGGGCSASVAQPSPGVFCANTNSAGAALPLHNTKRPLPGAAPAPSEHGKIALPSFDQPYPGQSRPTVHRPEPCQSVSRSQVESSTAGRLDHTPAKVPNASPRLGARPGRPGHDLGRCAGDPKPLPCFGGASGAAPAPSRRADMERGTPPPQAPSMHPPRACGVQAASHTGPERLLAGSPPPGGYK